MNLLRSLAIPVAVLSVLTPMKAHESRAEVVYDNLSQAGDPIGVAFGLPYNSFSTGAGDGFKLTNVKLLLGKQGIAGSTSIGLYADSGSTEPGSLLATLGTVSDTALGLTPSVWDVTPASEVLLSASTRYWIGLTTDDDAQSLWWEASTDSGTCVQTSTSRIPWTHTRTPTSPARIRCP